MSYLRVLIRFPLILLWLISCLLSVATLYAWVSAPRRSRMNRAWSRLLLRLCGVKLKVTGQPQLTGAVLWVANHVSWIDIYVLAGVRGILFIAKSEIRQWPVIGWLVARVGTVFLQRGQRNSLKQVAEQMAERFSRGEALGLFAEGTTSSGLDVLPFHASLFDPAMRTEVDIQPVALRFFYQGRRSEFAAFVGEETLVQNLWTLMKAKGVAVEAVFLPVLSADDYRGWHRGDVAQHVHEAIGQAVREGVSTAPETYSPTSP
ncbi:1-acyl-sn-glycerol-3-phosphate acyltransferase [Pusillimonas sp. CC-YST705]|uniref:1-acyl-sn-glycerol-3-phosphate acyltransferase n=2 Tax=Mesopusillimonas faecipullorum TaxID=2755040 RepID=A0ABS8C9D2_9BURK|nr:1-acyl-sn-glycerol-3-phosphate acyltransferase [Mesopusillimonas faecipullorum]